MDGSSRQPGRRTATPARRTATPAVLASVIFTAASAVFAIAFVTARGGLQMPIAATPPPVAVASAGPTEALSIETPGPTTAPSGLASVAPATLPPGPTTPPATAASSPIPTAGAPTLDPSDPLLALPPCPDLPGCFEYTIRRGDTLSGVASRYLVPVNTVLALNPQITDPSTIVVGQVLYLGRDPFLRLPACPDTAGCSLYTIQPGDRLSTIAARYGITVLAILDANPTIPDANTIFSGQVIRLPHAVA